MNVRWSAAIVINGSTVSVIPTAINPTIQMAKNPDALGQSISMKTFASLKAAFPSVINFEGIVSEIGDSLKRYSTILQNNTRELGLIDPIFNRRGDLLLELGTPEQQTARDHLRPTYLRMDGNNKCTLRSMT
jgi:hypothetical protein